MTPNLLSLLLGSLLFICFGRVVAHSARPWRDSGWGAIVLEEAWATPDLLEDAAAPPLGETHAQLNANLLDIHHQRLRRMDENDIDFMVLSCPSPCAQGHADPDAANRLAYSFNNKLAAAIANNTARFGAFAALSMHNATEAALELNRTVKELDFLGAMIFDYQVSGPNADRFLYYDQPEYDPFWRMVTDLDVPVYLHPRVNAEPVLSLLYKHAPWLKGPTHEYAATLSTHILGLCTNGVFDRFPDLKIIVGHLGEQIPSDVWRIDDQLKRAKLTGMPMQRHVAHYLRKNIWETTSANFATDILQLHLKVLGYDRILYSIDYPFVTIEQGTEWMKGLVKALTVEELFALRRGNAMKLLKLDGYHEIPAHIFKPMM